MTYVLSEINEIRQQNNNPANEISVYDKMSHIFYTIPQTHKYNNVACVNLMFSINYRIYYNYEFISNSNKTIYYIYIYNISYDIRIYYLY